MPHPIVKPDVRVGVKPSQLPRHILADQRIGGFFGRPAVDQRDIADTAFVAIYHALVKQQESGTCLSCVVALQLSHGVLHFQIQEGRLKRALLGFGTSVLMWVVRFQRSPGGGGTSAKRDGVAADLEERRAEHVPRALRHEQRAGQPRGELERVRVAGVGRQLLLVERLRGTLMRQAREAPPASPIT